MDHNHEVQKNTGKCSALNQRGLVLTGSNSCMQRSRMPVSRQGREMSASERLDRTLLNLLGLTLVASLSKDPNCLESTNGYNRLGLIFIIKLGAFIVES